MRKIKIILSLSGLLTLTGVSFIFASELIWEDISRGNTHLNTVLVDPQNPHIIYFGSNRGVFKSQDFGLSWRNILSIHGENRAVNSLSFGFHNKNHLYAASANGLYFSPDCGKTWRRIFQGRDYREKETL
ncbi:MAG: WD40/YVTN/BNR-like repeat-containing protein, partial [Candidatus Omnitrophota bacterium]